MNSEIRAALSEIADLLEQHQEHHYAEAIRDALHGPGSLTNVLEPAKPLTDVRGSESRSVK